MTFHILTLFPKIFESVFSQSITSRAIERKQIALDFVNIRDFTFDKHKTVDDKPYGGGSGMIMKVDVIVRALESIKPNPYKLLLSPSGTKYNQNKARQFSTEKQIALICGHYEGTDARIENFVDETISVGNFILTGGEIAAMIIIDSITRLLPGVINTESLSFESFSPQTASSSDIPASPAKRGERHPTSDMISVLEYPQYTKPQNFRGIKVPTVLLSGNHAKITNWRNRQALKLSKKLIPSSSGL